MIRKQGLATPKRPVGVHHAAAEIRLWELEQDCEPGRVPRISRLMACAVLIDDKIRSGEFENQAAFAKRYQMSEMAVSQILKLLQLAPDIAEKILFLPLVEKGGDPIKAKMVRLIAREWDWRKQRIMWRDIQNNL